VAFKGFLDNPQLYSIEGNERLNEIVVGVFKNKYDIIHDGINAVVSIG